MSKTDVTNEMRVTCEALSVRWAGKEGAQPEQQMLLRHCVRILHSSRIYDANAGKTTWHSHDTGPNGKSLESTRKCI